MERNILQLKRSSCWPIQYSHLENCRRTAAQRKLKNRQMSAQNTPKLAGKNLTLRRLEANNGATSIEKKHILAHVAHNVILTDSHIFSSWVKWRRNFRREQLRRGLKLWGMVDISAGCIDIRKNKNELYLSSPIPRNNPNKASLLKHASEWGRNIVRKKPCRGLKLCELVDMAAGKKGKHLSAQTSKYNPNRSPPFELVGE